MRYIVILSGSDTSGYNDFPYLLVDTEGSSSVVGLVVGKFVAEAYATKAAERMNLTAGDVAQ